MPSSSPIPKSGSKDIIQHPEFIKRIKKTLYYGASSASYQCDQISRPLADYAADIFSATHKGTSLNRLDFAMVSKVKITPCSLILSMIYLDRLQDLDPAYAHRITPSELFLVAMMVSTKFYCGYDEYIYVSEWADYGNMSVESLKELELDFLDAMDWNIYVSSNEFFEKLKSVEQTLAKRQGLKRGWLTYTELLLLMPSFSIATQILNASAILAVSYSASVITIITSFFLASQVPGTSLSCRDTIKVPPTRDTTSPTPLSDLDNVPDTAETELNLLMDEITESIDRFDCAAMTTVSATRTNCTISPHNRMYLNELLQSKCTYGHNIGTSTGALLTNYYNEGDVERLEVNCTDAIELTIPDAKPKFFFPMIWFKFM